MDSGWTVDGYIEHWWTIDGMNEGWIKDGDGQRTDKRRTDKEWTEDGYGYGG